MTSVSLSFVLGFAIGSFGLVIVVISVPNFCTLLLLF